MPRSPARFLLKLDCETTGDQTDNQGEFEHETWVSPDNAPVVDPNTGQLALIVGDSIAFAVGINGGANPTWINDIIVVMTASTNPANRAQRYANNNSPFRLPGTNTPLNLVLTSTDVNFAQFQRYNADGTPNAAGPYIGTAYMVVAKDVARGSSPSPPTSKYEATIVASLTDSGTVWQFSYDPEMDVDNGSG